MEGIGEYMVYGNIYNEMIEVQIKTFPKAVQYAIRFLMEHDMNSFEAGRYDICPGDIPMILQVIDMKTAPRETLRPEIHRKNIDLQFLASGGPEAAGFYIDEGRGEVDEDLLGSPRDILFYKNDPAQAEGRIVLKKGSFALYFPWDVHIPGVQMGEEPADIRKIVIKVPMDACV